MYEFPRAAITRTPVTTWLQTAETYSLPVLEARVLRSRRWQAVLPTEGTRKDLPQASVLLLVASAVSGFRDTPLLSSVLMWPSH